MSKASEQLSEELSELFRENVSVDDVTHREMDGATVAIANFTYWTSGEHRRQYRQTALILQDDQLDLPEFSLRPHMTGMITGLLQAIGGVSSIEYADSPEFSQKYFLHGWAEEAVRVLFTKDLRDFFEQHPGWSVRGKRRRLVIYHRDRVMKESELNEFTREGLQLLTLLQQAEEELDQHPELRREVRPEDVAQAADNMGGIAGMLLGNALRKLAVSRRELETFVQSAPPRDIPRGMKRQVLGDNLPLVFIGILFFIGGIVGGTLFLVLGQGAAKGIGIPFLVIFPVAGFLMTFLTIRHRRRKSRTLRSGSVVTGKVVDVKKTGVRVNNQMRFHVHVEYDVNGRLYKSKFNAYGSSVDQARALRDGQQPARMLIDPADPNHAVCVDTLIILGDDS